MDVSVDAGALRSIECRILVVLSWLVAVIELTSPSSNLEIECMTALTRWSGYDLESFISKCSEVQCLETYMCTGR